MTVATLLRATLTNGTILRDGLDSKIRLGRGRKIVGGRESAVKSDTRVAANREATSTRCGLLVNGLAFAEFSAIISSGGTTQNGGEASRRDWPEAQQIRSKGRPIACSS